MGDADDWILGAFVKHASSRALFDHWDQRRGTRAAPERVDIDPRVLRAALGDSFILTLDPSRKHPFRIAGTRICALFGQELHDVPFADIWDGASRTAACDLVLTVAEDSAGVVAGASGRTVEGASVDLELLLLPLRHHGDTHARQIGVLAPLAVPYWLGAVPMIELALGMPRYIAPAAQTIATPFMTAAIERRTRRGLVVYDGGRSR